MVAKGDNNLLQLNDDVVRSCIKNCDVAIKFLAGDFNNLLDKFVSRVNLSLMTSNYEEMLFRRNQYLFFESQGLIMTMNILSLPRILRLSWKNVCSDKTLREIFSKNLQIIALNCKDNIPIQSFLAKSYFIHGIGDASISTSFMSELFSIDSDNSAVAIIKHVLTTSDVLRESLISSRLLLSLTNKLKQSRVIGSNSPTDNSSSNVKVLDYFSKFIQIASNSGGYSAFTQELVLKFFCGPVDPMECLIETMLLDNMNDVSPLLEPLERKTAEQTLNDDECILITWSGLQSEMIKICKPPAESILYFGLESYLHSSGKPALLSATSQTLIAQFGSWYKEGEDLGVNAKFYWVRVTDLLELLAETAVLPRYSVALHT
jgi:hypothetical protein